LSHKKTVCQDKFFFEKFMKRSGAALKKAMESVLMICWPSEMRCAVLQNFTGRRLIELVESFALFGCVGCFD